MSTLGKPFPSQFPTHCKQRHNLTSCSHYVAFVKKVLIDHPTPEPQWVLFNDEKVVLSNDVEEMKKFAYVYFFERM